jgi:hypothetical protein
MVDWQIQLRSFHFKLDVVLMRRNFDPVHLFDVPELGDENTVMNC